MFKPAALFIGLRYLRSVQRESVLSFYAWVSILGLVIGVATLIVVLSVLNGFEQAFEQRVLSLIAPIKVMNPDPLNKGDALYQQLKNQPHVKAVAPFTELPALVVSPDATQMSYLWAVDPASEKNYQQLIRYVQPAQWQSWSQHQEGILLGQVLAEKLKVRPGTGIRILLAQANGSNALPMAVTLTVMGILKTDTELDKYMGVVKQSTALPWLQRTGPQGFKLLLDQPLLAPWIASDIAHRLSHQYTVIDWTENYSNLYQAIKMPRTVMGFLLLLILLVAAFNLTTSLIMTVRQKNKQIATLRTYGFNHQQILGIFLVQGALIGLIGISVGVGLGCMLAIYLPDMITGIEHILHITLFQGNSYFVSYLPSVLKIRDVIYIASVAWLLCICAASYPAWRAVRLQPAEVFRQNS